MSENFKKLFKKKINKQARMIFSFQAAVFLAMLGYMIFKIIYLRSTTGLTDTIINELSGSFIESGIPIEIVFLAPVRYFGMKLINNHQ